MHEMKLRNREGQTTLQHIKAQNQYVHLILSTIQNKWKVANSDHIYIFFQIRIFLRKVVFLVKISGQQDTNWNHSKQSVSNMLIIFVKRW